MTDLVNKTIGADEVIGMAQLDRLEQFIDNLMTVRELLTSAKNPVFVKSSRLEMINEAVALTENTIKELGAELLTESLMQLRMECADEFVKVAEEATVIT